MILLVHSSPKTLEANRHPCLGVLSSPRRFYTNVAGWRWAADNDAFSEWDPVRYRRMLARIRSIPGCLFVTAPDVVGDAAATLKLFREWQEELRETGLPVALVGQDGLVEVPWDEIDAFFVGGTSMWKMGTEAAEFVREAKRRGKWVHMGRVNSLQRLLYAKAIGCDSVDGSQFSWFRDTKLPMFLALAAADDQMMLT